MPRTIKIMESPDYNIPEVICMLAQWDFRRGTCNIRQIKPYIALKKIEKDGFSIV